MSPCGLRCAIKARRIWDKALGCWCSTLLDFLSPAVSRSVWPDSGVGVWAKSTTAKWPCIWATSPERATPWWSSGFFAQRMAQRQSPPGQRRCSQSLPGLAHASPVGLGDVGQTWCRVAAWLDER